MPITIGSNIQSLTALRHLSRAGDGLTNVFEKLSSGQRINRASDDAAGLAIVSGLDAKRTIFNQAVRNLRDGTSLLSVSESALTEIQNILTRQIELAQQSANGVFTLEQTQALHEEAMSLRDEFNRILATTDFNGQSILTDNFSGLKLQAGIGADAVLALQLFEEKEFISFATQEIDLLQYLQNHNLILGPSHLTMDTQFLVVPDPLSSGPDTLLAFNFVEGWGHDLALAMVSYVVNSEGHLEAEDHFLFTTGIEDWDFEQFNGEISYSISITSTWTNHTRFDFELTWSGDGAGYSDTTEDWHIILAQDGTFYDLERLDTYPTFTGPLAELPTAVSGDFTGLGQSEVINSAGMGASGFSSELASLEFGIQDLEQGSFSLLTQASSLSALERLKEDSGLIQEVQAKIGALQSRIEVASQVLQVSSEQSGAASSRIKDADMAAETAEFVRLSIIQEAAVSVLAQANLQPELALLLLSD